MLEIRGHADPVSDQLVGDGLSGRDGEGRRGSSEQGLNCLNKNKEKFDLSLCNTETASTLNTSAFRLFLLRCGPH